MVSTAAFHARVRGSLPGLGGLKETKMFLPHLRVKVSIVGSLRDREVACSASDRQGSNFESCVWRTVSSQSSHHPQEVLLAQFSLYVHKGGQKPDSFHLLLKDNDLIRIPDFTWFGFNRRGIYKKASKDSGGVGILVRDSLFRHFNVNIVDQSVQGIIGIELVNKATDYIVRLYSCYLPPEGSPWANINVFYEHSLGELYLGSEAVITIFGGDSNARVDELIR